MKEFLNVLKIQKLIIFYLKKMFLILYNIFQPFVKNNIDT